jgi:hypothetical protein
MKLLHALGDEAALAGSLERPLLQAHCGRLALGYVGVTSSCAVRVWG